jgi:ribosomal protein S1
MLQEQSLKVKLNLVTDFGVFIGVEEGIDGLVHISDFSWTKRVNHPQSSVAKRTKSSRCCI